ncbi:hypothetical protein B0H13DRAFT_1852252 [Mycena leptocephala]|nr:hypothetical protein B0H13DRAFT_1852252 [Mycena leptocephala]
MAAPYLIRDHLKKEHGKVWRVLVLLKHLKGWETFGASPAAPAGNLKASYGRSRTRSDGPYTRRLWELLSSCFGPLGESWDTGGGTLMPKSHANLGNIFGSQEHNQGQAPTHPHVTGLGKTE